MKKALLAAALLAVSAPSLALTGLTVGANGGVTRLSGNGSNEYGHEVGIHASYSVAPFLSVSGGYTAGEGKVATSLNQTKTTVDYTTIPVELRADIPLLIGDVYAKAGANYYDVNHNSTINDSGWGFSGGAGFVLTFLPVLEMTLGYEYREMGELTTDSVILSIGADL
uniref:outer membrane beta-barrel protein n=1 Tax=Thaumasiovibrio occultus TaxID=1891184 RepID=UPI00131CB18E|nr:outer membrane beta-barrel protein [Thaumasiovibrio occultus]